MPPLRPLVLLVKAILNFSNVNHVYLKGISSYCIVNMVSCSTDSWNAGFSPLFVNCYYIGYLFGVSKTIYRIDGHISLSVTNIRLQ